MGPVAYCAVISDRVCREAFAAVFAAERKNQAGNTGRMLTALALHLEKRIMVGKPVFFRAFVDKDPAKWYNTPGFGVGTGYVCRNGRKTWCSPA